MGKLTIIRSVRIAAEPARVFRALTDPKEIVRCLPLHSAESAGMVGGTITLHGDAGGVPFTDHGTIEVFDPPRAFQYRYWSDNHGTDRTPENHLTIRYDIASLPGGGSELSVTHGGVPPGPYHDAMSDVWSVLLDGIRRHAEAAPAPDGEA